MRQLIYQAGLEISVAYLPVFLMIRHTHGNLLEANVDALINTVNEVGVMGKGIALVFREAFVTSSILQVARRPS